MSHLIRGLSDNGGVVFCGIDSTEIVRTAEKLHTTSATCSAALGRLLTGAALMGSMLKDDRDTITRATALPVWSSPAPTAPATSRAASTIRWWNCRPVQMGIWMLAEPSVRTAC